MQKETILFITNNVMKMNNNTYDYKDGIYNNITNNETYIRWSGQKKNKSTDKLILNKDNIHIWYRSSKRNKYEYYGKVKNKNIVKHRKNDDNLIVDLFVEKVDLPILYGTIADEYDYINNDDHQFTKYKMDCFQKLHLIPKGNWCSGIMEGICENN